MTARRVALGFAANTFDKVVIAVAQLVLVPVLSSAWGLAIYGTWILLSTVPGFLAMGDLGLGTAAGIKMTITEAHGDREATIRTFHSATAAILASSALLVAASVAVALLLPDRWLIGASGLSLAATRATLLVLLLWGITIVQQSILFAALRCAGLFAVSAAAHGCIVALETALLVALVSGGAAPPLAAGGLLAGRLIGVATTTAVVRRRVRWLPLGLSAACRIEMRSLLVPAGSVMLLPVANALYLQGSAMALGAAAGPAAVPAFTAVRTLSRIGLQACLLLNTALMPEFSVATARGDRPATATMVLVTLIASLVVAVPMVLGLTLFGVPVVRFWSHGTIVPARALLVVMAGSTALIALWYPLSNLLLAMQRPLAVSLAFVGLSLLGVPVTYLVARTLDATGAGIVMASIDLAMVAVVVAVVRRLLVSGGDLRRAMPIVRARLGEIAGRALRRG